MCFFLSLIRRFDSQYEGLFYSGINDDDQRDEGTGGNGVHQFIKRFGWIHNATQIAEHERITLEAAWNLKTIEAVNALSYIKAKNSFEKQLLKSGTQYK